MTGHRLAGEDAGLENRRRGSKSHWPDSFMFAGLKAAFQLSAKRRCLMATTETTSRHKELEELARRLTERVDQLRAELNQAEKEHLAVVTTLGLLTRGSALDGSTTLAQVSAELEADYKALQREFRDLTQIQALVKIAKESPTRRFRLTEARDKLIAVGLIRSR